MFFRGINEKIEYLNQCIVANTNRIDNFKKEITIKINDFEQNINTLIKMETKDSSSPVIMDLLRKIAKLEAIKEAVEHRRTSTEIIAKYSELYDLMLKSDREEKDITILKEKLLILKWVLGEDI